MPGHSAAARQAVHLGSGLFALLLRWLSAPQAALLAAAALLFNHLALTRLAPGLFRTDEARRPLASGIHLYPIAVLLLILLFGWRMEVAASAWVIMAAGDPAAAFVGRRWGTRKLPWNPAKSIAGSAAFTLASFLACAGMLVYMGQPAKAATGLALPTALFAAFVESLPWRLNDNLTVPLLSALFLAGLVTGEAIRLPSILPGLAVTALTGLAVNIALAILFTALGSVDRSGAVTGAALGTLTWACGGGRAFAVMAAFFLLGTGATQLGRRRKERRGVAQEHKGTRSARHALANCGVAAYLAVLMATATAPALYAMAFVCAYATAAFDTVSSEIGQAWGGRPVMITTLRRVEIGTDGALTLLGTVSGLLAAMAIGFLAVRLGLITPGLQTPVAVAAFAGSTADSLLGATLERRGLLDNDAVNFSNTLIGALAGLVAPLVGAA
jgi:uncharacterized protein (TIGR00297 family)